MKNAVFLALLMLLIFDVFECNNHLTCSSFMEVTAETNLMGKPSGKKIEGKMTIEGNTYSAICDCTPIVPEQDLPGQTADNKPKCDPAKLKIMNEKQGAGSSINDIRELIGSIQDLKYIDVESSEFSCLDGRTNKPVLASPGGDAGEFILALMVYEDLLGGGRKLSQDNVDMFFNQYLKLMKPQRFIMCTDDSALSHIEKDLLIEGLNILNPKTLIMNDILTVGIKPENIGDLHLKMMLKYPDQFGIRKEIVEMFIQSFYKLLWNRDNDLSRKLELRILSGEHNENAFIEVRSEEACQREKLAPLLMAKNKKNMVFINHLDASAIRREQLATFFSNKVNHHQDPVEKGVMQSRLSHHGFIALEITGSYIAKGLPFYTIVLA